MGEAQVSYRLAPCRDREFTRAIERATTWTGGLGFFLEPGKIGLTLVEQLYVDGQFADKVSFARYSAQVRSLCRT